MAEKRLSSILIQLCVTATIAMQEVLKTYSVKIVKSNYGFFQLSDLILKQRLYLRLGYTGLLRRFRPGLITLFKIMRLIGR
jgi:hypothetical protein